MAGLHFDITGDNDNFMRKLSETKRGVSDASTFIGKEGVGIESIFSRLAKGALAFSAGLSAKEIVSNVMQIRGQFQQLEVAFNTMLGSEQKANDLMQQLTKTAATTPFDLQSVANGAKQLLAYGDNVDNVNEDLIRLGNIASGLSQPLSDIVYLYGTTMTQGRLYTADFNQFTGRGIPMIKELAKQFGVAEGEVKGLVESGKVGFPEVQKVIQSLTNEGGMFFNLMEEQSKTIPGQISNISDAIDSIYNNLGKQTEGVINDALSSVSYLVENYEKIGKTIIELSATYGAYKTILITITALQKVHSVVLAQAAVEQSLCALAGHKLSDAQAIAVAKTKLLTIAQQGLIKSLKATGAALVANPYVLVAAAVAGLSLAIYKVVTAENEFDKANKRLNDATTSVEKSLTSEVSKLASLERKLSETKKGTEEYNNIKKAIVDNYGQYYKGLDGEIERIGNLSTVYGQLVEKMRLSIGQRKFESFFKAEQENLDNTIGEKLDKSYDALIEKYGKDKGAKLYQQVFDYAIRGTSMSTETWNQINGATFKEWGFDNSPVGFAIRSVSSLVADINSATVASGKALDEFKEKYQMTEQDVENILSGKTSSSNNTPTENKTLKQLLVDIDASKLKIKDLQEQANKGLISSDKIKEEQDVLAKLTSDYKRRTDKEYGSTKGNNLTSEQADRLKAIEEYRKSISDAEAQVELDIRQQKIDALNEGAEKEIAQIGLNYDRLKDINRRRSNEMIKEQQELERKQWEYDNPRWKENGMKFAPSTTSVKQLSSTQQQQLISYDKLTDQSNLKSKKDILDAENRMMNEHLKEYGDYMQKRQAITELYDEKIAKATTEGEKLSLGKELIKSLSDLDIEANKSTSVISALFDDMSKKTVEDLHAIADAGEKALQFLQNGQWDATTGVNLGMSEETFKTLKDSPKELDAIIKAIINIKKEADQCETSFNKISGGLKKMFSSGGDTKKFQEGLAEVSEGMNDVMQAGQFLSDSLSELGNAFGNDTLTGIAEGVNVAVDAMGSAMDGAKAGAAFGPWGAAAGAAIGMVTSLASSFAKIHDAKNEKRIAVLQDQIEVLDKTYEKLGESVEKAYSTDTSNLINQQNKLLEQQKVLINQQIREEEDKKKTDNDRINEWREQLEEIDKTLADNKEKAVDAIFGEDLKSAIDNFAQAYADAWASNTDKAKSAKDTVKNMMRQMVTESIKAAIDSSKAMEKIRAKLEEFYSDKVLTGWEQDYIYNMAEDLQKELDSQFGWADGLMKDDEEIKDGVSGQLQAAMTEGTASQLVGLWNSTAIDLRELKNLTIEQRDSVKSVMVDVKEIIKQNYLIEQNTRRGADNTDGLIDELNTCFETLDKRLGTIEKNTKSYNGRG